MRNWICWTWPMGSVTRKHSCRLEPAQPRNIPGLCSGMGKFCLAHHSSVLVLSFYKDRTLAIWWVWFIFFEWVFREFSLWKVQSLSTSSWPAVWTLGIYRREWTLPVGSEDVSLHYMKFSLWCLLFRSRLGCQVCVKKSMDGLTVQVPMEVSDLRRQMEVGKQSKQ